MSDEENAEKKQVYFLDREVHNEHLSAVRDDITVILSHIHYYSSDTVKTDPDLLVDLCEYYCTLEGFRKLLTEIKSFPIVPSADETKEEYVLGPEQALLLKFYLPMLVQLENKVRRRNLSLAVH